MSRVIDATPPEELTLLLTRFRGVVCEYQFFRFDGGETSPPTIDDLRSVARRTIDRCAERWIAATKEKHVAAVTAGLWIDPVRLAAAVPRAIGWDEFLGPEWTSAEPSAPSGSARRSYTSAFADPPHGLYLLPQPNPPRPRWRDFVFGPRPDPAWKRDEYEPQFQRLMTAVIETAVGAEVGSDRTKIWEWPTDWSGYFDAGHEWWGSCCWTLWTEPDRLVGIVASTTD